jgi:hypothetical protein
MKNRICMICKPANLNDCISCPYYEPFYKKRTFAGFLFLLVLVLILIAGMHMDSKNNKKHSAYQVQMRR